MSGAKASKTRSGRVEGTADQPHHSSSRNREAISGTQRLLRHEVSPMSGTKASKTRSGRVEGTADQSHHSSSRNREAISGTQRLCISVRLTKVTGSRLSSLLKTRPSMAGPRVVGMTSKSRAFNALPRPQRAAKPKSAHHHSGAVAPGTGGDPESPALKQLRRTVAEHALAELAGARRRGSPRHSDQKLRRMRRR